MIMRMGMIMTIRRVGHNFMKYVQMSGNNKSVRNYHLQHFLVYVDFNNFAKFNVNVIIGVDKVKEYLIRVCINAEICREDAGRFALLLPLLI